MASDRYDRLTLVRVETARFVAGFLVSPKGPVVEAAPILYRRAMRRQASDVIADLQREGAKIWLNGTELPNGN
jgi:hypothetical protein